MPPPRNLDKREKRKRSLFIMTNRIIAFVLLLFVVSACNVNKYSKEDIDAIVEKTDNKLKDFTPTHYQWASKQAYSEIKALYPEPDMIFLNETYKFRSGGDSFNLYYFKDGALIYFKESKLQTMQYGDNKLRKVLSKLILYLNQDGSVVEYYKNFDKKKADLEGSDVDRILSHAKELYNKVKDHTN
jgi:outer membrane lipoprotein-sorting protein